MEEHKIGEIFQHGDTWLQCVKGKGCEGCVFKRPPHCDINCALKCCGSVRSDKEDIIFKELPKELPIGFEFIYQDRKLRVEEYKGIKDETIKLLSQYKKCALCDNDGECLIDEYFPPCFWDTREDEKNIIYREVTDDIKETKHRTIKFKYMEPERKKLTIPEGWEFDKLENGEIILKTKEPVFPATLNDCCLELGGDGGIARGWGIEPRLYTGDYRPVNGILIPEGMGKPMLALCQLLICRNAWWKVLDWKPDWEDRETAKFVIEGYENSVRCNAYGKMRRILAFPTEKVRDKFLETFKDLIEEAKELL